MRVRNTKIQVVMKWRLEAQSNSNSGMWAYIILEYTSVLVCSCVSTLKVRPTVKEMIGTKTEFKMIGTKTEFNERNEQTRQTAWNETTQFEISQEERWGEA